MENPQALSDTIDIVYSEDEDVWYLQRFPGGATSQSFATRDAAMRAYRGKTRIKWTT